MNHITAPRRNPKSRFRLGLFGSRKITLHDSLVLRPYKEPQARNDRTVVVIVASAAVKIGSIYWKIALKNYQAADYVCGARASVYDCELGSERLILGSSIVPGGQKPDRVDFQIGSMRGEKLAACKPYLARCGVSGCLSSLKLVAHQRSLLFTDGDLFISDIGLPSVKYELNGKDYKSQ